MRLLPTNRLIFPANFDPGVNLPHAGRARLSTNNFLSVVARPSGGVFIDVSSSKAGTLNGAPTSGTDGVIGPYISGFSAGGGVNNSFGGYNAITPTSFVAAGIIIPTASATDQILATNSTAFLGLGPELRSKVPAAFNNGSGGVATSGITLGTNVPYFVGWSVQSGAQNYVVVNLLTGAIQTATGTSAFTIGAGTATYAIGGSSTNGSQCKIAAFFLSYNQFLGMGELLTWAADPWSFWYPPPQFQPLVYSVAARPITTAFQPNAFQGVLVGPTPSSAFQILDASTAVQNPFQTNTDLPATSLLPIRIDQTWVWSQVRMLGQDKLPVGEQVFDLAPKATERLPYYGWEWSQVRMLGQDRLPVGARSFELAPVGPKPIEQTWTWRQVGMLGQDTLPFGRTFTDLTPPIPRPIDPTWVWRQVGMLGQDVLPFGRISIDLAPFGPKPIEQTWTISLQQTTLAPVAVARVPGVQLFDTPVQPVTPAAFTWTWRQVDKLGLDTLPVGKQSFDLAPRAPLRAIDLNTWIQSVNLALNVAPTVLPRNQYDWPNPLAPQQPAPSWTWRQVGMLGLDVLPFNQYDWPTPKGPQQAALGWTWNQIPMLGQDRLPIGKAVFDLVPRAGAPVDPTWLWRQTGMLGKDTLPFGRTSFDLTVPLAQQSAQTWISATAALLTARVQPFTQTDWPLPAPQAQPDRSFTFGMGAWMLPAPTALPPGVKTALFDLPPRGAPPILQPVGGMDNTLITPVPAAPTLVLKALTGVGL